MKTKFNHIIILAAMLAGSSACNKWVDTKPMGAPTTAFFWQSDNDLKKATADMYVAMRNESTWGRNLFWVQDASDDLIVGRSKADAYNIKNFIPSGREGYLTGGWNDLYSMINRANQVIQNVPASKNTTEAARNQALGEAYFIRGFAHFWVANIW